VSRMVRKQIYIEERQDALLKRQARARKASQAELIREAIDRQVAGGSTGSPQDPGAWEEARCFMESLGSRKPREPRGGALKRDALYEDRLSRYDRGSD